MPSVRWFPSEVEGVLPIFLLELDLGGQRYFLATQPCTVTRDDGTTQVYASGLDIDAVDSALDVIPGVDNTDSLSVDVLGVPLASIFAAGRTPELGSGELSLWMPGTTWERRRVLLAGTVSASEYGSEDEPVTVTLGAPPWLDGGVFPAGTVVGPDNEEIVIPEIVNAVAPDSTAGYRLQVIKRSGDYPSQLLVASGVVDVGGSLVSVYDGEGRLISAFAASGTASQDTRKTSDGRTYTIVEVSGIGTESADVQESWKGSEFYLRASAMDIGGRAGEGLADFVATVYGESQFEIDADSVRRVEAAAPQLALAMTVRNQNSPWRVLRDELIPLLPMAVRTARGRLEVFYLPLHSEQPPVATLDSTSNVARVTRVRQVHTLRTLRGRVSVEYRGATTQGAAVAEQPQANLLGNSTLVVRSAALPSKDDRRACADELLPLVSPRLRVVEYEAAWYLGWLDLGDAVSLTDSTVSLTSAPAFVIGVQHRLDGVRLSLLLY